MATEHVIYRLSTLPIADLDPPAEFLLVEHSR